MAGAFSGLLAYGITFMAGTRGLLGWSWIFVRSLLAGPRSPQARSQILEGIATVCVGCVAFLVLHGTDFPACVAPPCRLIGAERCHSTAKFLRDDERSYVLWRKSPSLLSSVCID